MFLSHEFAIELVVVEIPEWVYSLADVGAWANETPNKTEPRPSFRETFKSIDKDKDESAHRNFPHHDINGHHDYHHQYMEDLTLAYVMAFRLQRKLRARRDERALAEAGVRRASQIYMMI